MPGHIMTFNSRRSMWGDNLMSMIILKPFQVLTNTPCNNPDQITHYYSPDAQPWKEYKNSTMPDQDEIGEQELNHVMRKSADDAYSYYA